ncbi:MAG: thioredoxin-disulfide reductase [Bacilli bacterium]
MYDCLIIGAGPAGLTAALYAARANKKVLVIEKNSYGGQIINTTEIENYPGIEKISGFDFATNLYNQVKNYNVDIKFETVLSIDKNKTVTTNKNVYEAKSIVIATGVQNRKLELENERKLIGRGISFCALCDGNFYKDKTVAVVGGGNTAVEDAIYLSNVAKKVYLIHRNENFKCENRYLQEAKNIDNVEIITNANVEFINGKDFLENIDIKINNENIHNLEIDGLFIAIGQVPNNKIFKNVINIDKKGYIISDENLETNIKGIFVAGDTRVKKYRQLTTATSDGTIAVSNAINGID